MKKEELDRILEDHGKWLRNEGGGRRANLRGANLSYADLSDADLSDADLSDADLSYADLRNANLSDANLRNANLSYVNLSYVNLSYANLSDADLSYADLSDADLSYANLRGAKGINPLAAARLMVPPQSGAFEAWKKCREDVLVKLSIPADAKRSSATGRKCRASHVKVLEVIGDRDKGVGVSRHNPVTVYRVGENVHCDNWDEDRWNECSGGIHFFMTREEAEGDE